MKLVKIVELVFFCDDANGEYGLTHEETVDEGFNAFYNGIQLWHDIAEHSHEYTHKYFKGKYAMNVGGEMAAMGAMWYYYYVLGVYNRLTPRWYSAEDITRLGTQDLVQEAITYGYCNFGHELECNIPYQKPSEDASLEYIIEEFNSKVKTFRFEKHKYSSKEENEYANQYKRSVTKSKIARLHRYGYNMAKRLVPDCWQNTETIINFITFWNEFCKNNPAEELQQFYKGVTFRIYKNKGIIHWTATLIPIYRNDIKQIKLNKESNTQTMEIMDYYLTNEY